MRVDHPQDIPAAGSGKPGGRPASKRVPPSGVKVTGALKTAVSESESRSSELSGRLSAAAGTSGTSKTEIADTVRILISLLDRDSSRQRAFLPLLQLVRELPIGNDGKVLNTKDRRLLQRILKAWRERFGGELESGARRELEALEKQLSPGREEPFLLFFKEADSHGSGTRFSVEEKKKTRSSGEEGDARLILDLEMPVLGKVRSSLEGGGETGTECRIACSSGSTRRSLRKALPLLRERLAPFRLKNLSLGRLSDSGKISGGTADRDGRDKGGRSGGLRLWG